MVIGTNPTAEPKEFEEVLQKGVEQLTGIAETTIKNLLSENSINFEKEVFNALKDSARGTKFDNCIERISGHKFPDIVFNNRFYGVEVKSIRHEGWGTFGNSIFESTRPDNVDRIYVLAGRLTNPIEFRYKSYEKCIDDIQVTHSPRYHIDMDTKLGETIFEKMGIPYDEFREMPDLLDPVKKFYKSKLKPGESLWWLENDKEISFGNNLVVGFFNDLPKTKKDILKNKVFALFPILFSTDPKKYRKLASWLVAEHGVVLFNARDFFSAGGQQRIVVEKKEYKNVPKIFGHLRGNVKSIKEEIDKLSSEIICENWGVENVPYARFAKWVELIEKYSEKALRFSHFPVRKMIMDELNS